MNVIGHQDIGVNGHPKLAGVLLHQFKKKSVVGLRQEDLLPVVAALDDVMGQTRNGQARKAGHGARVRDMVP